MSVQKFLGIVKWGIVSLDIRDFNKFLVCLWLLFVFGVFSLDFSGFNLVWKGSCINLGNGVKNI